jgi:hypothetical protein
VNELSLFHQNIRLVDMYERFARNPHLVGKVGIFRFAQGGAYSATNVRSAAASPVEKTTECPANPSGGLRKWQRVRYDTT